MKPYFSFQWHITDECDQRCKHCYILKRRAYMSFFNELETDGGYIL